MPPNSNVDIRKDAPAVTGQGAPGTAENGPATGAIIPPVSPGSQAVSAQNFIPGTRQKGRPKKSESHIVGFKSKVNTLALKFYDEQLPGTASYLIAAIKNTSPKDFQVLAIRHDRDTVTDGIWAVSAVKPHWHVIVRLVDQKKRLLVNRILAGLGVVYRPGLDDELWKEHGVETIGNFAGYAVYLTHETAEAIRDAKERYDISEIISNLTPEEIQQVRDGYVRVSEKRKLTQEDLIALDKEAYDRGYALKTLDDWFADQPFNVRSAAKIKVITDHYYHGVEARIKEHVEVSRTCIYIQGAPNKGKTYAAEHALLDMGLSVYHVQGGGTGKFDGLTAAHEAILIDDETCPNLLNMTDDYICQAYKRGRNNPPWTGKLLVVTSNVPFYDWLDASGMRIYRRDKSGDVMRNAYGEPVLTDKGRAHAPAMRSRFFLTHVETDASGTSHLELDLGQEARRGSIECQQAKIDAASDFRNKFNSIIREYRPRQITPDWTQLFVSTDGSQKLYRCWRCGHIGTLGPDTTACEACGARNPFPTLSYNEFLTEATDRDVNRIDALVGFACWFWESVSGGFAWYIEQNPEALFDPMSDYALAFNATLLEMSIDACLHRCPSSWRSYLDSYPVDEIVDAVVFAWQGGFEEPYPATGYEPGYTAWQYGLDAELRLLTGDPGYDAWEQRVLRTGGHKICDVCRKSFPLDVKFCGQCGRSLPDVYFFDDDIEADIARYQLATERGCDMKDVPYDDVKARIPVIANHMDY